MTDVKDRTVRYIREGNLHVGSIITGPQHVYLGLEFSSETVPNPLLQDRCEDTPIHESKARGSEVLRWVVERLSEISKATGRELHVSRLDFCSNDSHSRRLYDRVTQGIIHEAFDLEL